MRRTSTGASAISGLAVGRGLDGDADLSALRTRRRSGPASRVLYVVDPGPDGSMGDVAWVIEARKAAGSRPSIYQGVLRTELSQVADVVLPGAAWVEKDADYTNDQGLVQAASKAHQPPGEAVEDWQILTSVAAALGSAVHLHELAATCAPISRHALAHAPAYAGLGGRRSIVRSAPRHWLAGQQPDGTLEVGRDVPGPAAGEGPQRADGARAPSRR